MKNILLSNFWQEKGPFIIYALKSTLATALSWQIAMLLLGPEGAPLAPVSAVIILQITSWQTLRKSIERALGILIGIILAIVIIHLLGISFWTIALLILCAHMVGMFVQKRGAYLAIQIPISAVIVILAVTTEIHYPLYRIVGVLIGGVIGTLVSLLLSPPIYITRARQSVGELIGELGHAMPQLVDAINGSFCTEENQNIYTSIKTLEKYQHSTEQALALGFESARLNPWALHVRHQIIDLPEIILTLNKIGRQMLRMARTVSEESIPWSDVIAQQNWVPQYAQLLQTVGELLNRCADYMLNNPAYTRDPLEREALHTKKETIIHILTEAQQQLQQYETDLLHPAANQTAPTALADSRMNLNAGHLLAIRGTLLTDLRRMLEEIHQVVTLLPWPEQETIMESA